MFISKKKYNEIINKKKLIESIANNALELNDRILKMQGVLDRSNFK